MMLWHGLSFYEIAYCSARLQSDGQIERWKRACQWVAQPLNRLPLWLTLLCTWPVIRRTATGTIFAGILHPSTCHFFAFFLFFFNAAKHLCVSSDRNTYLPQTGKPENTPKTGRLMACVQMEKEKKNSISERNWKKKHFIFIILFSSATQSSQQIHYTTLLALAALPKFPTSTSISQSVYCLLLAFFSPLPLSSCKARGPK